MPPAPVQAAATPVGLSVRDRLASAGYDVSGFADDGAAWNALLAEVEAYQRAQPYVQYGMQAATDWEGYQRWKAESAQRTQQSTADVARPSPSAGPAASSASSQAQSPAAKQPGFEWNAPEYDPDWLNYVEVRDGRFVPKQFCSPEPAQKLNAYRKWEQETAPRILREFPTLARQAVAEEIERAREEMRREQQALVDRALAWKETLDRTQQYLASNAERFFQKDEQGQFLRDQQGQLVMSPRGRAMHHFATEARQRFGMQSPEDVREYAERQVMAMEAMGAFNQSPGQASGLPSGSVAPTSLPYSPVAGQPQVQPAAPNGQAKRERFVERVTRAQRFSVDRGGSIPASHAAAGALQNPDASLEEIFDEESRKRGLLPPA